MPTPIQFFSYPQFPSDPTIRVIDIPTLSFEKLQIVSEDESLRLYHACREEGFLFLKLNGSKKGETLLQNGGNMFDLIESTLTLDQQTLEKYVCDAPRNLIG